MNANVMDSIKHPNSEEKPLVESITPWNPSHLAISLVRNPLPIPTKCPYCAAGVECVENKKIYGKNYGAWPWIYRCLSCDAYVEMHSYTDIPLGTMYQSI